MVVVRRGNRPDKNSAASLFGSGASYAASVASSMWALEKRSRTVSCNLSPSTRAYAGSSINWRIARAKVCGFSGGTKRPLSLWRIISFMPPTRDAIEGMPAYPASMSAYESASVRDGARKISNAGSSVAASVLKPTRNTRSASPRRSANSSRCSRSGPSPIT